MLHAGTTLQIGAPEEVRLRPKSALVARLMGHANLFEVAVLPGNRIRWGTGELHVAAMNGSIPARASSPSFRPTPSPSRKPTLRRATSSTAS